MELTLGDKKISEVMKIMKKQTAGHDALGEFAPEFAYYNDDVLFGEVWSREDKLSLKLRSVLTISALVGKGIVDNSLKYHIQEGKNNGISKDEMVEILTQLGFYAGWPNAWAAFRMAKEVYANGDLETHGGFFGLGEPNTAYSKYFIGNSYLKPLTNKGVAIANVTFEPGCRNNWHVHKADEGGGQILLGVDGSGWAQIEGQKPISMVPGTVVVIPPNTKHWHGAKKDSWFSHLAIAVPGKNTSNEWLEPVEDDYYNSL